MNIEINKKYEFYASIYQINDSTYDTFSIVVKTKEKEELVIRVKKGSILDKNGIYYFVGIGDTFKEKKHIRILSFIKLEEMDLSDDERYSIIESFNRGAYLNPKQFSEYIEKSIDNLENKVIKDITSYIYNKYKEEFNNHPAAMRFHHAYKYGLLYHTYSVLKIAEAYTDIYPHINKDLVNAGVILHDISKINEFSLNPLEFTNEGKLLGHVSMGMALIKSVADKLGYGETEEALLLEHIILSHHDQPEFGSPRRPQIIEALIVHLADMSDAKIQPALEALADTPIGSFTEQLKTNDKEKYYKHSLSK